MHKENLLAFFKDKNELVNQNKAFTSIDLGCVNAFRFVVSNREDKYSIRVQSIENLIDAVKEYYSKTDKYYKNFIIYNAYFNESEDVFVSPELISYSTF